MGAPRVLRDDAQVAAFRRDWALPMPLAEMAALHGFRNLNSVSRAAQRLGLPKRPGGPLSRSEAALTDGRWVKKPGSPVQVWEAA